MTGKTSKTMVNSWNEWDPLKHVIVGRAEGAMLQAPEPAVYRDFAKDGFPYGKWGPMPEERVAKAVAQLENFVGILEKHGIEVIPVPFYDVVMFGGCLHCATADVYREGMLEDYFPNQVEGF